MMRDDARDTGTRMREHPRERGVEPYENIGVLFAAGRRTQLAAPPRVAARAANATDGAGPRRPPPPVVPALKKAKGQIAKKKER